MSLSGRMDQRQGGEAALWLVFVWITEYFVGIRTEGSLSCWTVNVTADKTSYLYYYRGDPGEFVKQNIQGHQPYIPNIPFNSSAYVLGAVAADNKQPISLFVHDKISGGIYRFEDNLKSLQPVFRGSSVQVEDIAVDWLSNNIYYTDPLLGVGLVSYTKHFAIIIHKVAALHGIDVDPMSRMLFYADGDSGHIYQASLTGENHKILSGSQTTNPTALVVDAVSKVLYWIDEGTQYLQSWNYARSEFKKIWNSYTVGVGLFTGIDLYEPYLFISLKNEQRMKVVAVNGTELLSFSPSKGIGSMSYGISISTSTRKPHVPSVCDTSNGGCEHICIHESNIIRQCLCQFGYTQNADICKTEVIRDNFLLFTDTSSNILYQVDTQTEEFHTLYVTSSLNSSPGSPVYDPEGQNVYWIEKNKHEIWMMNLDKRIPRLFVNLGAGSVINTIILAAKIRYIYYADIQLRRIGRINLNTIKGEVILQLTLEEEPTYIDLDTGQSYVYWINGGNTPKIERANMNDGSNRQKLVSGDLQMPSGLAVDVSAGYLYWVDEILRKVERSKLDGSKRETFTITPASYRTLTLDEKFLYLTGKRALIKIQKEQRKVDQLGPQYFVITSSVSCYSSSFGRRKWTIFGLEFDKNTLIIIGVVAGGIVLLIIIIAISVTCVKCRKTRTNKPDKRQHVTHAPQLRHSTESNKYEDIDAIPMQRLPGSRTANTTNIGRVPVLPPSQQTTNQSDITDQYLTMQHVNTP